MTEEQKTAIRIGRSSGPSRTKEEAYASMPISKGKHIMDQWKKYKVNHGMGLFSIELKINHAVADTHIEHMVRFWSDWEVLLESVEGDYTKAFLKNIGYMFGPELLSVNNPFFHLSRQTSEGWCKFNETNGIVILSVETERISYEDIEIEEL